MTGQTPVKKLPKSRCQIVGVMTSQADLLMALTLTPPPDLFELRLDHLLPLLPEVENSLAALRVRAPLILTARHPQEGGAHQLSEKRRRDLLSQFLSHARYVDVELRSAESFHDLLSALPDRKIERILSVHDFDSTPTPRSLHAKARNAKSLGASLFKLATRTDNPAQLARLLEFMSEKEPDLAVSVMGIGQLAAISRVTLAGCGSSMAYAALADKQVEGQPTVPELQELFRLLELR